MEHEAFESPHFNEHLTLPCVRWLDGPTRSFNPIIQMKRFDRDVRMAQMGSNFAEGPRVGPRCPSSALEVVVTVKTQFEEQWTLLDL